MRSWPAIVLQTLGVAVLVTAVYLAFLKPDDLGDVGGIDAGNGTPDAPSAQSPPKRSQRQPREVVSAGPTAPTLPSGPAQLTTPGAGEEAPPDTPGGAQYSGTVARLLAEVARGGP